MSRECSSADDGGISSEDGDGERIGDERLTPDDEDGGGRCVLI